MLGGVGRERCEAPYRGRYCSIRRDVGALQVCLNTQDPLAQLFIIANLAAAYEPSRISGDRSRQNSPRNGGKHGGGTAVDERLVPPSAASRPVGFALRAKCDRAGCQNAGLKRRTLLTRANNRSSNSASRVYCPKPTL